MGFEWDSEKNRANIEKHGLDFKDIVHVFEGRLLEFGDARKVYGEERIIAIWVVDGHEITVVYTIRGPNLRLISARRSSRDERRAYRALYPHAARSGED